MSSTVKTILDKVEYFNPGGSVKDRIALAMVETAEKSGVDSAVAALLLKRAGHDVTGVTMKLWREGRYKGGCRDACFGPGESKDIALAGAFAKMAGIEHRVFDCADEYERVVIEYFRREKAAGRTPNPCVVCNALVKFGVLVETAMRSFGFDRFATGHYARIVSHGGSLAAHALHLMRECYEAKIQFAFPRICRVDGGFVPPCEVDDADLEQMMLAFRIVFPQCCMTVSTRESPDFRDRIVLTAADNMSAGSRVTPGGYASARKTETHKARYGIIHTVGGYSSARKAETAQFTLADARSPAEVFAAIRANGQEAVFKTWDNRI